MIVALVGSVGEGFEAVGPFEDFDMEDKLANYINRVHPHVRELLAYEVLSRATSLHNDLARPLALIRDLESALSNLKPRE